MKRGQNRINQHHLKNLQRAILVGIGIKEDHIDGATTTTTGEVGGLMTVADTEMGDMAEDAGDTEILDSCYIAITTISLCAVV